MDLTQSRQAAPTESERRAELERFKTVINLVDYAASQGYVRDRKASSRASVKMGHPDGDAIIISRSPHDRHWRFFSVHGDHRGSVIDLAQYLSGKSLGAVRHELRSWMQAPAPTPSFGDLSAPLPDLATIRARLDAMDPINGRHPYLESDRRIPSTVLAAPRFQDRIRIDSMGNAIFPHWNLSGPCGYEIKNRGFTGFAPGGKKGLWCSQMKPSDLRLVITESAIDALSYAALRPDDKTRYVSTSGQVSPEQRRLLTRLFEFLPRGGEVILAADNDPGGDAFAQATEDLFNATERSDCRIIRDFPEQLGQDWNDILRDHTP